MPESGHHLRPELRAAIEEQGGCWVGWKTEEEGQGEGDLVCRERPTSCECHGMTVLVWMSLLPAAAVAADTSSSQRLGAVEVLPGGMSTYSCQDWDRASPADIDKQGNDVCLTMLAKCVKR